MAAIVRPRSAGRGSRPGPGPARSAARPRATPTGTGTSSASTFTRSSGCDVTGTPARSSDAIGGDVREDASRARRAWSRPRRRGGRDARAARRAGRRNRSAPSGRNPMPPHIWATPLRPPARRRSLRRGIRRRAPTRADPCTDATERGRTVRDLLRRTCREGPHPRTDDGRVRHRALRHLHRRSGRAPRRSPTPSCGGIDRVAGLVDSSVLARTFFRLFPFENASAVPAREKGPRSGAGALRRSGLLAAALSRRTARPRRCSCAAASRWSSARRRRARA